MVPVNCWLWAEAGASLFDGFEHVEQVARGARQAVQARDHQHVAGLEPVDQLNNALAVTYRVAVFYELPPRCSELFKFARTT
jgi:hypothetical protein